jgi:pimeloyl-ACP methyl ester carboxylesterase
MYRETPEGAPFGCCTKRRGTRLAPHPRAMLLHRLGVRLICFDRPGYGGSDRLVLRRVAEVAPDAAAIANHLGIEGFAVLGRSGGGPHALACAALLPERVTRAGALTSLVPPTVEGLDWSAVIADLATASTSRCAPDPRP